MGQANESQKRNVQKELAIKKVEKNEEQLEIDLDKEKDAKLKYEKFLDFLKSAISLLIHNKPIEHLFQRLLIKA